MYPAYAVGDADNSIETTRVAAVARQRSSPKPPAPKPEVPDVEKLLQQLERETQSRPPAVVSLQCRRRWNRCYAPSSTRLDRRGVFLLGKSGHAATRCSNFYESFPFLQPGGFIMIPPRVTTDCRRAENCG